jgi:hypothetical protein
MRPYLLVLLLCCALVPPVHSQSVVNGRLNTVPKGPNSYTEEQEIQIGRKASAEAERQLPILAAENPISVYVRKLGQRLLEKTPNYKYPYTFKVVNSKDINAFALPGGPVYMNLGIILEADNEEEVAGVLGHEISHVAMRHSTRDATKKQRTAIPLTILGAVLGSQVGGIVGELAQLGINVTAGSVFLKYSRDAEREADLVGAQILYDVDYDPFSMAEFFTKLQSKGGGRGPQFLSSHPDPGNRAQRVSATVARFPRKNYPALDQAEFEKIQALAKEVKPGATGSTAAPVKDVKLPRLSPEQVAPANGTQIFQHNAFLVSYPANWRVDGDANSSISIAPPSGATEGHVAYGVLINGFRPRSRSLDEATQDLVRSLSSSNPNLQATSRPVDVGVSGQRAKSLRLSSISPVFGPDGNPLPEQIRLVTVATRNGVVLYFLFVAPQPDFANLAPAFDLILGSVQLR